MSIIGDALFEETEPVDAPEALLVLVAELREQNRRLQEDREFYRDETYRQRRKQVASCFRI